MSTKLIAAIVASLILSSAAQAQAQAQAQDVADRVLGPARECRRLAGDQARLACMEREIAALDQAVAAGRIQILDRTELRAARKSLFGLTLPAIDLFSRRAGDKDDDAFIEINTHVRSARALSNGRGEIILAEPGDPTWQTTDTMNFPPRPGTAVRIRKGAMGGYFIKVDNRSYRGVRIH